MASRSLRANRAHVTTAAPINWPAGIPAYADFLPAQRLFAILGHDGTGDLIDALLAQMEAYDGDPELERDLSDLEDGDVDCCGAGDDQAGGFCHLGATSAGDDEDREPDHDAESAHTMTGGGSNDWAAAVAL